jgi:hypothetical protein
MYCRNLGCWQKIAKEDYCVRCADNHFQKMMQMVYQHMPLNWNNMLAKKLALLVIFGTETEYHDLDFTQKHLTSGPLFTTIPLSLTLPFSWLPNEVDGKVRVFSSIIESQTISLKIAGMCIPNELSFL